ncbi:hypothetical protein [Lacipirellula sp.]|uniref:hypothetical protein n=1 Tax=Lacipirellula sp. TaxID=2691419 RepID=UPI003D13FB8B
MPDDVDNLSFLNQLEAVFSLATDASDHFTREVMSRPVRFEGSAAEIAPRIRWLIKRSSDFRALQIALEGIGSTTEHLREVPPQATSQLRRLTRCTLYLRRKKDCITVAHLLRIAGCLKKAGEKGCSAVHMATSELQREKLETILLAPRAELHETVESATKREAVTKKAPKAFVERVLKSEAEVPPSHRFRGRKKGEPLTKHVIEMNEKYGLSTYYVSQTYEGPVLKLGRQYIYPHDAIAALSDKKRRKGDDE